MTDLTAGRHVAAAPNTFILPVLNLVMAAGLGAALGGWQGALAGVLVLALAYGLFRLAAILRSRLAQRAVTSGPVRDFRAPLRMVGGLLLIPFIPVVMAVVFGLSIAWNVVLKAKPELGERSKPLETVPAARAPAARFMDGFFSAKALPLTAINLLLLITLGCVAIGIEVAFYAALLAVPIGICTMVMVALDASREPSED